MENKDKLIGPAVKVANGSDEGCPVLDYGLEKN